MHLSTLGNSVFPAHAGVVPPRAAALLTRACFPAHEVARRELETLAHDQAIEQARVNATMINRERAERAAQGLAQVYPINARVKNLNAAITDAYSFDREACGDL